MLADAFSFRGRIGRLQFFLDSLALGAICVVLVIVLAFLVMPVRTAPLGLAFMGLCLLVTLPPIF